MKRLLLITVALTAFACDVEENDRRDESGETSQAGDLRDTDHMGGKADKATVDEDSTSLADEFDYCGEFDLYDDGECHRFCWEEDPDCQGVEDDEEDIVSPFDDCAESENGEDCDADDSNDEPEVTLEDVQRLCANFDYDEETVRDLGSTLCMERETDDEAFAACVDLCVAAAYGLE